jgi:hypothetical protein
MVEPKAERDQRVIAITPRGQRKPVLATMPSPLPLWNKYVEDFVPPYAGTLRDYRELLRLAKDREVIILNGSVGRRQRYRDVVFAIVLKWFRPC